MIGVVTIGGGLRRRLGGGLRLVARDVGRGLLCGAFVVAAGGVAPACGCPGADGLLLGADVDAAAV